MFIHGLKGYIPMKKKPVTVLVKSTRNSSVFIILISNTKILILNPQTCVSIHQLNRILSILYTVNKTLLLFFSFSFGSFRRFSHCYLGAGLDLLNFCSFTLSLHVPIYSKMQEHFSVHKLC